MPDQISPLLAVLSYEANSRPEFFEKLDDSAFYSEIDSMVHRQWIPDAYSVDIALIPKDAIAKIETRLRSGWFADPTMRVPQAWHSSTDTPKDINIRNLGPLSNVADKPNGAMWTASFLPSGDSAWLEHESAELNIVRPLYSVKFTLEDTAVYTIDSTADVIDLVRRYPRSDDTGRVHIDWERAAADLHAIHLTTRGLVDTHRREIRTPLGPTWLIGWDTESTAWLRYPPDMTITKCE